jgi:hypothetical protein
MVALEVEPRFSTSKRQKNASQGSQSQLSMNGSIEKKKGLKGGTAEKLPEITIQ